MEPGPGWPSPLPHAWGTPPPAGSPFATAARRAPSPYTVLHGLPSETVAVRPAQLGGWPAPASSAPVTSLGLPGPTARRPPAAAAAATGAAGASPPSRGAPVGLHGSSLPAGADKPPGQAAQRCCRHRCLFCFFEMRTVS